MLEIIHLSDTHFGPDRRHTIRGANACARAEALVAAVNELSFVPDCIVHTGDVVNDPDPGAYALAAEVLSRLKAPVYFATGNHDDVSMMRASLSFGPLESLLPSEQDRLCYRIGGPAGEKADLFVIDAKVPPAQGPHGEIPGDQIDAVLSRLGGNKPVALFLHYPMTAIGSPWIDKHLLARNSGAFQEALVAKAGSRLRGVFTGHLHRGLHLLRGGVLHSGVSSPACEFTAGPADESCEFLPGGPIPFHHVTLTADATLVKSYSIPFTEVS